jgi:hypothetical protein
MPRNGRRFDKKRKENLYAFLHRYHNQCTIVETTHLYSPQSDVATQPILLTTEVISLQRKRTVNTLCRKHMVRVRTAEQGTSTLQVWYPMATSIVAIESRAPGICRDLGLGHGLKSMPFSRTRRPVVQFAQVGALALPSESSQSARGQRVAARTSLDLARLSLIRAPTSTVCVCAISQQRRR